MAIWREDVRTALRTLGGQGTLDEIYEAVRLVRTEPLPTEWRALVRSELEYNSSDSDSFKKKHDWFYSVEGINKGIWGLRELEPKTPTASDLQDVPPGRVETKTFRILRDTRLARRLKKLHKDACQICGAALDLGAGSTYSEAHHIRPLGKPHNGPDVAGNIVVLCPNHHALLDFGAIKLDASTIKSSHKHSVNAKYLKYHNEKIFGGSTKTPVARLRSRAAFSLPTNRAFS
jgi:hypothetical protein